MRLAHYFRNVTIAAIVAAAFAVVFPNDGGVQLAMALSAFGTACLIAVSQLHAARLCSWCSSGLVDLITPRMDLGLRIWHQMRRIVAVLIIDVALLGLVLMILFSAHHQRLLATEMLITMSLALLVDQVNVNHARLLPWCPYCRRDDGDADPVPAPVPEPSGVVG